MNTLTFYITKQNSTISYFFTIKTILMKIDNRLIDPAIETFSIQHLLNVKCEAF